MAIDNPELKDSLIRQLREVFTECDLNHDGIVQKSEIDEVVKKHHNSSIEAQIIALFSHCFDDIKSLHREGWFERKDGITIGDLFVLEQLLEAGALADLSDDEKRLTIVTSNILNRTNQVWKLKPSLYGSFRDPDISIRPIAVRRGNIGNCHFLSALASVAATKPKNISSMIDASKEGCYSVEFPDSNKPGVVVLKPTIVELSLYGQLTRMGYWPCVMEKAFGSYMKEELGATSIAKCLDVLTGSKSSQFELSDSSFESLVKEVESFAKDNRAMVALSKNENDRSNRETVFHSMHPYTVLNFDSEHGQVSLRDPYGPKHKSVISSKKQEQLRPRARMRDGIFTLSLEEYFQSFDLIVVEGAS